MRQQKETLCQVRAAACVNEGSIALFCEERIFPIRPQRAFALRNYEGVKLTLNSGGTAIIRPEVRNFLTSVFCFYPILKRINIERKYKK